jgi:hypothetical protein
METKESSKNPLPWHWLLVLLSIGGFMVATKPLTTSRPERGSEARLATSGLQDVDARLWQDPFGAVLDHQRSAQASGEEQTVADMHHSVERFFRQVRADLISSTNRTICLMPVLVRSSPYAEDVETRLRTRLAVTLGLSMAQFNPVDPDHLGFVRVPWEPKNGSVCRMSETNGPVFAPITESPEQGSIVIPVERFQWNGSGSSAFPETIVMWIRTTDFTPDPIPRLARLTQYVTKQLDGVHVSLRVIGPADSDGLAQMLDLPKTSQVKLPNEMAVKDMLADAQIVSPRATLSDFTQVSELTPEEIATNRLWVQHALTNSFGVAFVNATPADDQVMQLLVAELSLRGINPWKDPVAVVYERDTLYGRGLRDSFIGLAHAGHKAQAEACGSGRDAQEEATARLTRPEIANSSTGLSGVKGSKIVTFTYYRGLDGELAGPGTNQGPHTALNPRAEVRADGRSHSDYLARLTERMKDMESDTGTFKAVCVFGSDVYDKLLILRAMRPHFPGTVFTTTDLDARYLQADYYEETRNLIVASVMGNSMDGTNQVSSQRFTPFRDSYQPLATRSVMLALTTNVAVREKLEQQYPVKPRVYEVGRSRAVRLDYTQHQGSGLSRRLAWLRFAKLVCLLGAALLLFRWLRHPWERPWEHLRSLGRPKPLQPSPGCQLKAFVLDALEDSPLQSPGFKRGTWIGVGITALAVATLCLLAHYSREPRSFGIFLEGITIWPTELGLLLTATFCSWSLCYIHSALNHRMDSLEKAFFLLPAGDNWRAAPDRPVAAEAEDCVDAREVWQAFRARAGLRATIRSGVIPLLVGAAAAWGLTLAKGIADAPARGDLAFRVDWVLHHLSVAALLVLLTGVVVRVRQVWSVCTEMGIKTTRWPEALMRKVNAEFNIPDDLSTGWCDVQFLGALTSVVGVFIYLPFIGIALFAASHWDWFDNWSWSGLLLGTSIGGGLVVALCALAMRHRAEVARSVALRKLEIERLRPMAAAPEGTAKAPDSDPQADRKFLLEQVLQEIRQFSRGAFAPLLQQPIIGALLIPLGSSGSLALLERLLR